MRFSLSRPVATCIDQLASRNLFGLGIVFQTARAKIIALGRCSVKVLSAYARGATPAMAWRIPFLLMASNTAVEAFC
jgi:hypothetical protein